MLQNQLKTSHKPSRWDFIKTGLLISALAICFLIDRNYFFYPPSLAPAWNNVWFDITGLLAGVDLILCGVLDVHIDILVKLGLGVSVAFLTVLLVAESFHIVGAGYFRFHPVVVFEIYVIANLMQTAYEYDPQN
nr:hypothetical protein [Lactobacillus amylovorus]